MNATTRNRSMSASPSELLTTTEAAALLNVSKRTLFRLIGRGELPVYRVGSSSRTLRVHRVDALALVRRVA